MDSLLSKYLYRFSKGFKENPSKIAIMGFLKLKGLVRRHEFLPAHLYLRTPNLYFCHPATQYYLGSTEFV